MFPVRQSLDDYILLAAAPHRRKFGKVDHEPLEKLIAWVKKTYPINPLDRLSAVDAIGYAVRFQVKGVRQDPAMFRALVSLLQDKEEPVRSTAAGILMPLHEPSGQGAQRRRSPEGGWEKWLEDITATDTDALRAYQVCANRTSSSGNSGTQEPVELFCVGYAAQQKRYVASGFQFTLRAAEEG